MKLFAQYSSLVLSRFFPSFLPSYPLRTNVGSRREQHYIKGCASDVFSYFPSLFLILSICSARCSSYNLYVFKTSSRSRIWSIAFSLTSPLLSLTHVSEIMFSAWVYSSIRKIKSGLSSCSKFCLHLFRMWDISPFFLESIPSLFLEYFVAAKWHYKVCLYEKSSRKVFNCLNCMYYYNCSRIADISSTISSTSRTISIIPTCSS